MSIELNNRIAAIAEEWARLQVPYKHRGSSVNGCDCTGLLIGVLKSMGFLSDFVMPVYSFEWNIHRVVKNHLLEYIPQYCDQVCITDKIRGDIALFQIAKTISHAGIIVSNQVFVHSYYPASTCYGVLSCKRWKDRLVQVWRINDTRIR